MKYKFSECIDIARVQRLTDLLFKASGVSMSVADVGGVVMVKSGWQDLCARFHRTNPGTLARCLESDTDFANQIGEGNRYTVYRCRNGLIDAAIPIRIEGEHVGNFFAGQFLFGRPDIQFFRQLIRRFGFDEEAYMQALSKIPVMEESRFYPFLGYLSEFAELLGETGLKQLRQVATMEALQRSEGLLHAVIEGTTDVVYAKDREGKCLLFNTAAGRVVGKEPAEVIGKDARFLFPPEQADRIMTRDKQMLELARTDNSEETLTTASGERRTFLATKGPLFDGEGRVFGLFGISRDITERSRAEEDLRESEERLRMAQEAGRIGVFDWDIVMKKGVWSPKLCDLFGLTGEPPENTYHVWASHVHPDDLLRVKSLFGEWIRSDRTEEQWEYRFFRPDGEMRWMSSKGRIIRDRNGRPLRSVGTTLDITDLKRSQNLMRAQRNLAMMLGSGSTLEEQVRLYCETFIDVSEMDCAVLYLEEQTGSLAPAFSKGFGRDMVERLSGDRAESAHAYLLTSRKPRYGRADEMGLPEAWWKEGLRSLAIVPLLKGENVLGCLIAGSRTLDDIPAFARSAVEAVAAQIGNALARLRAEKALRESEEKYRALFEESRDAIIIATLEGEVTDVNRAFLELLGYAKSEAVGLFVRDVCFDPRQELNLRREILRSGGVKDFGLLLKKKDGTVVDSLLTMSARLGPAGTPLGYQGIIRDVTEQRRLEREVLQISGEERHQIGQDLHDNIGQHMLGIALKAKSLALTLEKQSLPEAKDAERLTDLVNQAVSQVRDLSKGLVVIDFEAGGICPALKELADRIFEIRGIPCSVFFPKDGIEIDTMVVMQIFRIAQEAVVNAAKHSSATHIEIHLAKERGATAMRVEDDGVGISKTAGGFKGLGLRLMKYRAEMVNGSLEVRDRPGGGTIIELVVPDSLDGR